MIFNNCCSLHTLFVMYDKENLFADIMVYKPANYPVRTDNFGKVLQFCHHRPSNPVSAGGGGGYDISEEYHFCIL